MLALTHKGDNLTDLLYQLVGAGYSPSVRSESGRITALKLDLSTASYVAQTQQLIKSAIDGVVAVDSEVVRCKNMNLPMHTLSPKLSLKSHLSYYAEKDG